MSRELSKPPPTQRSADVLAGSLTLFALAALWQTVIAGPRLAHWLGFDAVSLSSDERLIVSLLIYGSGLMLGLPGLVLFAALSGSGRPRAALVSFVALVGAAGAWLAVDLSIFGEFGRHLSDVVRFLLLPRGREAAGSMQGFGLRVALFAALSLLLALASLSVVRPLTERLLAARSPGFRRALAAVALAAAAVVGLVPPQLSHAFRRTSSVERLFAALPFDPRLGASRGAQIDDPALRPLESALERKYKNAFARLFVERASDASLPRGPRPHVVVIVLESWRRDALTAEFMPKLTARARSGLLLERHSSGSIYSEAGLFALLYGRSPLQYHATLDRKLRPELCELLRRSGYACAYFSGQPRTWMRQEEFVAPENFDRFEHDDRGSWVDWDRRALGRLVESVKSSAEKPIFALAFLMSSHFEYQYPPEFERKTPADAKVRFGVRMSSLGAEAELPLRNRYANSMAFLDSLVDRTLSELPADCLVIVTGDHGESLRDDGRFGHGYSFAEVIATTPAFLSGPGIPSRHLDSPSFHSDFLPTLAHALGAPPRSFEELGGRDLLADAPPRTSRLFAHTSWDGNEADALFAFGARRIRLTLALREPRLRLVGFEDELGHPAPASALAEEEVGALATEFERELFALSRDRTAPLRP